VGIRAVATTMTVMTETYLEGEPFEDLFRLLLVCLETARLMKTYVPSDPEHHDQVLHDVRVAIDGLSCELRRRADLAERVGAIALARRPG
jgi:hypothetical protein